MLAAYIQGSVYKKKDVLFEAQVTKKRESNTLLNTLPTN
jgi:hypothetical protein